MELNLIPGSFPEETDSHELMLTIPREGMGKSIQDWNVPQGHQYGDDLADRRRIGHVRFNDRTGPNGEKLLHLEELQSDWHQKGRTKGIDKREAETPSGSED